MVYRYASEIPFGWGLYTSCEFGPKIQNLLERELETTRQLLKTMLEQKMDLREISPLGAECKSRPRSPHVNPKDILHVMNQLGKRRLENSLIYTHLVNFRSDDYTSAVVKDINEAQKLVESGFEYVTTFDSLMLLRKRK